MPNALYHLAARFHLVKLHVTVQLQQASTLPDFKGSMWHGWLGHVLKAHDEHAFYILYHEHDQQQPKPYSICPSGDHKTMWQKGELIECELTLFGQACELAGVVADAILQSPQQAHIGLGRDRTPYRVLAIASYTPQGLRAGLHTHTLLDWLDTLPAPVALEQEVAMNLMTPMRVKRHGQIMKQPITEAVFWAQQCVRRLQLLSRFWVCDEPALFEAIQDELRLAQGVHSEGQAFTYFEDWQRYSLKQKEQLPFGGMKGHISFYGELYALLPFLKIGELLHIGGKTTFGLGKYQLIAG
ncbi:CRISPR system precrRNA processing endoribonuclease RAMP protein Cas6 [Photobacterium damselae]|uniref:CRISPR system precrRNA processing endoribonuclease RAMP protein Cas6 n=1 Tax=Photobacterium damselae TaxID=38293 RepID=UPI00165D450E|nr:CRISPR system precrRNA processing endoribonuclease RAMP protein Cas6 [Photobacterium damselae]